MARPRKPDELKRATGTLQKCREIKNPLPVDKLTGIPLPPSHFTEAQAKEWATVTEFLHSLNLLVKVDLSLLEIYCTEMATYKEAQEHLRIEGRVIKGPNKVPMRNPWGGIANDAFDNAAKIANLFGISPVARTKIASPQKDNTANPVAQLLEKRKSKVVKLKVRKAG